MSSKTSFRFDQLNSSILIEIFDYLSFSDLFHSLFHLHPHLDHFIELYAKSFRFYQKIHQDNSNEQLIGSYWRKCPFLRSIHLRKIDFIVIQSLIEQYPLKQLRSLTIETLSWHYYPKEFYDQIWLNMIQSFDENRLHSLILPFSIHYCSLNKNLSLNFIALKSMVLQYISTNQMIRWLSFTPNLKRFKAHLTQPKTHLDRTSLVLSKLQHLNIQLEDNYTFNELKKLLRIFPSLYYFHLKLETNEENDLLLLQPSSWQHILEDQLSNLIIFQFQLNCIRPFSFETLKTSFNSENFLFK